MDTNIPFELNKIHNIDALEGMKRCSDKSIDLIVTSPPYNIRNTVGGGMTAQKGIWNNKKGLYSGYDEYEDNMPHDKYVAWQRCCLTEMMRILTDDGAIFYNHKWRVQNGLMQDRQDIVSGFPVRQIIIWWRKSGMNFNDGYFVPTYEVIYLIAKQNFKLSEGANGLGDVWEIAPDKNREHPAPFPEKLAFNCISSTEAKIVLDPFMGIGTTAIVSKKLGRKYLGFENVQKYVEIAEKTLKQIQYVKPKEKRVLGDYD